MRRTISLLIGLACFIAAPSLANTAAFAAKVTRIFDIAREGSKIGTDAVEIEKQGDTTLVKFTTHISVVIMFVEVYHYDHTASEIWNGPQFVSFQSQTNDNGKKHALTATVSGDTIRFDLDGKRSEKPNTIIPASFWNKSFLGATAMFDEDTGKPMSVKITDLGEEPIAMQGVTMQTHHYRVSGDIIRDLWFKGDDLVRLKMSGTDGSKIVSDLRP